MGMRFDQGDEIRLIEGSKKTPHGYLLVEARPTRTGVLKYRRSDGQVVSELRPPEELAKILPQIPHTPLVSAHRAASPEALDHLEGVVVGDVVLQDDGWVRTSVQVMTAKAINDIEKSRRRQLSGGFSKVRFEKTPGRWDGTSQTYALDGEDPPEGFLDSRSAPFDGVQRDLEFNHIMLCKQGRAGPVGAVRFDNLGEDDGVEEGLEEDLNRSDEDMKAKITLGGIEYEVEEAVARAFETESKVRLDSVEEERDGFKEQVTELTSERDDFKGQVTALEAEKAGREDESSDVTPEEVNERIDVLMVGRKAGIEYLKEAPLTCTKTNDEIRRDAVASRFDKLDLAEVSDAEVNGMFRVLRQEEGKVSSQFEDLTTAAEDDVSSRGDTADDLENAHQAMCDSMGAWSATA